MLCKNKKGSTELKIILFGLIFTLLINISLSFVLTDTSLITNYDADAEVSDFVDGLDLGWFTGGALNLILSVVTLFFSLFGVNFVSMITILPVFMTSIFLFVNVLVVFSLVMYLIDRIWIG